MKACCRILSPRSLLLSPDAKMQTMHSLLALLMQQRLAQECLVA